MPKKENDMQKKIAILGSTGSIGKNTLHVARHLKEKVRVICLAAHSNIQLLEEQAHEFHPEFITVYDKEQALLLRKRLPHIRIEWGFDGLETAASHDNVNFVVSAISGTMGLRPTIAAIKAGKDVGLANKEALVSGGALVMALAKKHGVKILPIDSEHSALFQCLEGESSSAVRRLILTASGGPFRTYSQEQLHQVTKTQTLHHPTWVMGAKVTVDSSTLMNKGLEVIEAHWLFEMPVEKIEVVVHPQSIIHSLVEFIDNSLLAQVGEPSMITPIQYAMTYPERLPGSLKPFDLTKCDTLNFFAPDLNKFPCLALAYNAIKVGGTLPCYMNAANEVLVGLFLQDRLKWHEIAIRLEKLMEQYQVFKVNCLEDILQADADGRRDGLLI